MTYLRLFSHGYRFMKKAAMHIDFNCLASVAVTHKKSHTLVMLSGKMLTAEMREMYKGRLFSVPVAQKI